MAGENDSLALSAMVVVVIVVAVVEVVGSTAEEESRFKRIGIVGNWPNVFDLGRTFGLSAGLADVGVPSLAPSRPGTGEAPLKGPHWTAASSPVSEALEMESVIE